MVAGTFATVPPGKRPADCRANGVPAQFDNRSGICSHDFRKYRLLVHQVGNGLSQQGVLCL